MPKEARWSHLQAKAKQPIGKLIDEAMAAIEVATPGLKVHQYAVPCARLRLPLLVIVTMRGDWGEVNPWQVPMGQITASNLRLAGAVVYEVIDPNLAAASVEAAARIAFNGSLTAAVLLSQRMQHQARIHRRQLVARLLADRGDMLVVSGLGSPTYDCAAAGDHPLNFYLWGAMGSAVTVGLGLALAQPKRHVLVVTGDGEMLMGLGALATVAVKKPDNLAIVVIDNEHYGETGMQRTHTAAGVDLAGIARVAGFRTTATISGAECDAAAMMLRSAAGPVMVVFKVSAASDPLVLPSWDGPLLKNRFRQALLDTQPAA